MYLKIFSMILIIISTGMIGFNLGNKENYRIKDLRELKKSLLFLKSQIKFNMPLYESFFNISLKIQNPFNKIFFESSEEIKNITQKDINIILKEKINKYRKEMNLANEDIEVFINFSKSLGFFSENLQNNNIDIVLEYIEEKINLLLQELTKNKRMFNSLGVLTGILICVLLV